MALQLTLGAFQFHPKPRALPWIRFQANSAAHALDYLAHALSDHGGAGTVFIARNGYEVWAGPESDKEYQIFSATKSFTSCWM